MKFSDNAKEWASVGAGAMLSGALAVIFMQVAVVKKANTSEEFDQAVQTARDLASMEAGEESNARSRLLLPSSADVSSPERGQQVRQSPQVATQSETGSSPVTRVERLGSGSSKDNMVGPDHVAGTVQRQDSEGLSDKASQAEPMPRMAMALVDQATRHANGAGPVSSINPKLRSQSQTVNAAFDEVGVRTPGEDFAWDVHEVFKDDEGPMPFFFVDEYTGTLMFGLGWQH